MNQQQLRQILKNTLNSARSKEATLSQVNELWKEFNAIISQIDSVMSKTALVEEPICNLSGLLSKMQKITNTLDDIKVIFKFNFKYFFNFRWFLPN